MADRLGEYGRLRSKVESAIRAARNQAKAIRLIADHLAEYGRKLDRIEMDPSLFLWPNAEEIKGLTDAIVVPYNELIALYQSLSPTERASLTDPETIVAAEMSKPA